MILLLMLVVTSNAIVGGMQEYPNNNIIYDSSHLKDQQLAVFWDMVNEIIDANRMGVGDSFIFNRTADNKYQAVYNYNSYEDDLRYLPQMLKVYMYMQQQRPRGKNTQQIRRDMQIPEQGTQQLGIPLVQFEDLTRAQQRKLMYQIKAWLYDHKKLYPPTNPFIFKGVIVRWEPEDFDSQDSPQEEDQEPITISTPSNSAGSSSGYKSQYTFDRGLSLVMEEERNRIRKNSMRR